MKNKISLPPFTVEKSVSCLSETMDWGLLKYNVPDIWEITEGEGVTVYLLDTAGESDHIDLINNIVGGANFSNSKSSKDSQGHATHCAGIICAEKNGIGVIGVAPKAKIVLIKVLGDNGSGSSESIARGLKYAYEKICETNTPSIVSMSLGSDDPLGDKVHYWIKKIYEKNAPIICASGNSGTEGVNWPARYPETIAIGAFDENDQLANFSTTGKELAFAAPGVKIYSTWPNGKYCALSGTSMATPFMAGITCLLLSKHLKQEQLTGNNDCKTCEDVRNHLIKHSVDMGEGGKDKNWGYGIVDLKTMMKEEN